MADIPAPIRNALAASKAEVRKRPPRRIFHSIVAPEASYMADIMFMQYSESPKYRKINDGMTCALVLIETATRYAYATPMTGKDSAEVCRAFEGIYEQIRRDVPSEPMTDLRVDEGSEFNNHEFNAMLQRLGDTHGAPIARHFKRSGDRHSMASIDSLMSVLKRWIENEIAYGSINEETGEANPVTELNRVAALPLVIAKWNSHEIHIHGKDYRGHRTAGVMASPVALRAYGPLFDRVQKVDADRGIQGMTIFNALAVGDHVRVRLRAGDQPRDNSRLSKPGELAKGAERWSNTVYRIAEDWATSPDQGLSFTLTNLDGSVAHQGNGRPLRTYRASELLKVPPTSVDVPDVYATIAPDARHARRAKKEDL